MSARFAGRSYRLGNAAFLGTEFEWPETDGTLVGLQAHGELIALFHLADEVRPEAANLVAELRAQGLQLHLWSGDRPEAVEPLARKLGLDQAMGGITPEGKQTKVQALQQEGRVLGFIGDGVNDTAALAQVDAGIAMASLEAAQAAAPINLLRPGLGPLRVGLRLARRTRAIVWQNLAWAAGYNLILIPLAMIGRLEQFGGAMFGAAATLILSPAGTPLRADDNIKIGGAVALALPTSDLKADTNDKVGYGAAFQVTFDLGKGHALRPRADLFVFGVEEQRVPGTNGREVTELVNAGLSVDCLYYFGRNTRGGLYAVAGLGIQNWNVSISTHDWNGDGGGDFTQKVSRRRATLGDTLGMALVDSTAETPSSNRTGGAVQVAATFHW